MNNRRSILLFLAIFPIYFINCASSSNQIRNDKVNSKEAYSKPYVILVSIDGYRYDYTDKYSPPNLTKIRDSGTAAEALIPVYPSKTFTNHYSIATGLYADSHGIVANTFYDPSRKEEYSLNDKSKVRDGSWYFGEPIWVSAEVQGLLSACYFWPGSEAEINGVRPTYFFPYDDRATLDERVEQVKKWLALPEEKRPHFITLYFPDVDSAGHHFGPDSAEVRSAVSRIDFTIGKLNDVLMTSSLPINLVVVSDHGMQALDPEKVEYLNDYVDPKFVRAEGLGPQVLLYFDDPKLIEKYYRLLKKNGKHFKVYKRENIPERMHYSKTSRVGDLIVVAEAPYSVGFKQPSFKIEGGNHGYDPDRTNTMWGIFYAIGPQIKEHIHLKPFRNIHIYPFLIHLLGLKATVPIDGDLAVLKKLIKENK